MRKVLLSTAVITGLLFIIIGVVAYYFNRVTADPQAASIPNQIAGMELTVKSEGLLALAELNQLHRQNFPLSAGAVGTYGLERSAKLWIAEAPFGFLAKQMTEAMNERIAQGNSPFTQLGEFERGERTIYQLDGLGQKHFYFQSNKAIIWLAANAEFADQAIQDTLEFYP
jgi:hypothetical protein